mmetsp:Transcript_64812/g.173981  ORF Transcript_64812/g.173981 Transcript_64812/m.173981 type:complete len:426 (+) Transcript_64812:1393-2670(+)
MPDRRLQQRAVAPRQLRGDHGAHRRGVAHGHHEGHLHQRRQRALRRLPRHLHGPAGLPGLQHQPHVQQRHPHQRPRQLPAGHGLPLDGGPTRRHIHHAEPRLALDRDRRLPARVHLHVGQLPHARAGVGVAGPGGLHDAGARQPLGPGGVPVRARALVRWPGLRHDVPGELRRRVLRLLRGLVPGLPGAAHLPAGHGPQRELLRASGAQRQCHGPRRLHPPGHLPLVGPALDAGRLRPGGHHVGVASAVPGVAGEPLGPGPQRHAQLGPGGVRLRAHGHGEGQHHGALAELRGGAVRRAGHRRGGGQHGGQRRGGVVREDAGAGGGGGQRHDCGGGVHGGAVELHLGAVGGHVDPRGLRPAWRGVCIIWAPGPVGRARATQGLRREVAWSGDGWRLSRAVDGRALGTAVKKRGGGGGGWCGGGGC